eukprot:Seg417.1 transcript_id=Seg417.1/GoldUCD/mRNA.D3Y31 product="PIN2/TERF1-interacting telomerase inhibitor 1" protein_id=Seg417.1/GoldUCD/D3Y31
MLAEPKYKQKWADDPRNLNWSEDKGKYGFKMLSKMGWSEGKGLGANESGTVSHVKVTKRKDSLGLGASTFHEDNWIAHQDDFSALLSKLNQTGSKKNEESKQASLQNDVKQSQRKIHYGKFIKSKDLSLKSKNDLACVFGQRSKSTPSTPQQLSEDEGEKSDTSTASCPVENHKAEHGFVTVRSEMNLQEYFEQRMAALKKRTENKANGVCVAAVEEENIPRDESQEGTKKNKSKKRKVEKNDENGCDEIADIEKVEQVNEKKNKKRKKEQNTEIENNEINDNEIERTKEVKEKKSKNNSRKETVDENVNAENLKKLCNGEERELDNVPRKKSKKSKRKKNENLDEKNELHLIEGQEAGMEKVSDEKSRKTKKSNKLKINDDENEIIDEISGTQENLEQNDGLKNLIPKKRKKSKKTRADDKTEEAKESTVISVSENVEGRKARKEKKKCDKNNDLEKNAQQETEINEKERENKETEQVCNGKSKKKRKNESIPENNELTNLDKKSKKKKKKE